MLAIFFLTYYMVPAYLQVILALAIVIILFVIGFMVYNYEYLRTFRQQGVARQKVVLFEGIKDFKTTKDDIFHTQDKNSSQYRDLPPSYNQTGGTEYSYNFWLSMDSAFVPTNAAEVPATTDTGFETAGHQTVLFVKGSKQVVSYKNICGRSKKDILVKSPLVKLENYGKVMTVEFNTVQGPDAVMEGSPAVCSELTNQWNVANAHKIALKGVDGPALIGKYNMYTIVIQDTFPQDPLPYRNKVRCRIYVNGIITLDKYVDGKLNPAATDFSTLKTNLGNLIVNPQIVIDTNNTTRNPVSENHLRIANLSYFNYAVGQADIDTLYASGYDNKPVSQELITYTTLKGTTNTGVKELTGEL